MTQQEERQASTGPKTAEFMAEGRQRIEEFADAQSRFWDRLQNSNRQWFDRWQSEATMAADFANKLTAAKSLTETASIFQNWTARHMEMAAEDARRALSDTQEILAAGARMWTNSSGGDGKGRGH